MGDGPPLPFAAGQPLAISPRRRRIQAALYAGKREISGGRAFDRRPALDQGCSVTTGCAPVPAGYQQLLPDDEILAPVLVRTRVPQRSMA